MEFTTVKELYRNKDAYLDKKITIGGWLELFVIPKHLDLS